MPPRLGRVGNALLFRPAFTRSGDCQRNDVQQPGDGGVRLPLRTPQQHLGALDLAPAMFATLDDALQVTLVFGSQDHWVLQRAHDTLLFHGVYPVITYLPEGLLALLEALDRRHQALRTVFQYSDAGSLLFGEAWKVSDSNWAEIRVLDSAASKLAVGIRDSADTIRLLAGADGKQCALDCRNTTAEMLEQMAILKDQTSRLFDLVQFNYRQRWGISDLASCEISQLGELLQAWELSPGAVEYVATVNQASSNVQFSDLQTFVAAMQNWPDASSHMLDTFDFAYFNALVNDAFNTYAPLRGFQRLSHEERIVRFRELDQKQLVYNRLRTMVSHHGKVKLDAAGGQALVLKQEFEKKRRLRSIRRLIADAYDPIQRLKPVFMMSPLSVANYLPPGTIHFDLVIFDEASQIRPADAYGAILRGRQVVVVGDNKQLPPTSFFDSVDDSDDEEASSSYESILGKFNSQGINNHVLRWHYRSAHEALIAVSNLEYYDNQLLLAPSPQITSEELGLKYHKLDNSYYLPGASVNLVEATAVAQAVIDHARKYPDVTLGVAVFSIKQAQAIRDELERLRKSDISTEPFFTEIRDETFFIKNLENVQGDERDVIFISIGYGKTRDGKVSLNFGALNRDGGERRLNVLITRARLRCEIFTNLSADDLRLDDNQSRGLSILKRYLKFAESGQLDLPIPNRREVDSIFEEVVASCLRDRGYTIDHQIGTAGFFVDLAVVDPEYPGTYLIGIECDGASYHSAASARDRDRLRQAILESKGWKIHRIWSTDWFRNPTVEISRTAEAIEQAKLQRAYRISKVVSQPAPVEILRESTAQSPLEETHSDFVFAPYKRAIQLQSPTDYGSFENVPNPLISQSILHVIATEGPIHRDVLAGIVTSYFGVKRARQPARERIYALLARGQYSHDGDFYWVHGQAVIPRNRVALPPAMKLSEYVAQVELESAVCETVRHYQPILLGEAGQIAWNRLGFTRVSIEMKTRAERAVEQLLSKRLMIARGDYLNIPE